jgi:FkbM family methyltransferase
VSRVSQAAVEHLPPRLFHSLLARQYAFKEPELRHVPDYVPRDLPAFDVGAWRGPWTLRLAKMVPRVHSFEASPDLARTLRAIVPANVEVHEVAVSDCSGEATLWLVDPRGRGADGRCSLEEQVVSDFKPRPHRVRTVALDDMDLGPVGFIKIDVEGHERNVLKGAANLLHDQRPVLLVEIEQRLHEVPIADIWAVLEDLGYQGWFFMSGRWRSIKEFDVDRNQLDVISRIEKSGYLVNSFVNLRSYISNFVFMPPGRPGPGSGGRNS